MAGNLAGWAADLVGLSAPLWIMLGLCLTAGVLALGLEETAPARRPVLGPASAISPNPPR